ncbi:hypothetical protein [uncultured Tateyamaria sp.]|uniref:hypothetical protein n=1 Tax=Tateyamaria sp. 1078 TaxID=3417464 RepID=UPI002608A04E|nr:hypothetical protein [uncultured Tateyamaria sp.]
MRATMFAAGLTLASTAAFAQAQEFTPTAPNGHVTLTNGCVYTRNELAQGNEWSLIYTQAGTSVQCPLTIYGQITADPAPVPETAQVAAYVPDTQATGDTAIVTKTQVIADIAPRPRLTFIPSYMVGVFR